MLWSDDTVARYTECGLRQGGCTEGWHRPPRRKTYRQFTVGFGEGLQLPYVGRHMTARHLTRCWPQCPVSDVRSAPLREARPCAWLCVMPAQSGAASRLACGAPARRTPPDPRCRPGVPGSGVRGRSPVGISPAVESALRLVRQEDCTAPGRTASKDRGRQNRLACHCVRTRDRPVFTSPSRQLCGPAVDARRAHALPGVSPSAGPRSWRRE